MPRIVQSLDSCANKLSSLRNNRRIRNSDDGSSFDVDVKNSNHPREYVIIDAVERL